MQHTTDLPADSAIITIRPKPFSIIEKILPALLEITLVVLIINERSAYYASLRAEGYRLPYADLLLLISAGLFPILTILFTWLPDFARPIYRLRSRLGMVRWPVVMIISLAVSWLFVHSDYSIRFDGFYTRLFIYLASGSLALLTASTAEDHAYEWKSSLAGLLVFGGVFMLMNASRDIVDYPFRLSWSEGNRFYDYSVLFGRDLYDYPADQPLSAFIDKGRQALWGLPYLFGRVSIGFMRFWNEFLFTIPYFLLGLVFLRRRDTAPAVPFLFGLWAMLFFNNGPIYTPLILICLMIVLTRRSPLWLAVPVTFAAGYLAHMSRFTWMFAPAIWAVLLAFLDPHQPAKSRWIRSIALGISGLSGGYILYNNLHSLIVRGSITPSANAFTLNNTSDMIGNQTLLWDRLFPTNTFALGVLPALIFLTLPVLALILFAVISRRWKLDLWQKLYLTALSAALLVVGVVISVKIGGGSNLHNLDMFLISVFLTAGLMLEACGTDWLAQSDTLKRWQQIFLVVALLYPATLNMFSVQKLILPDPAVVENGLERTQALIKEHQQDGEILFLDHRQLLTFGYIQNVPLVSDYEKKLLMEKAMTGDQNYFSRFYKDLSARRFSAIITEPLETWIQPAEYQFAHENNAWVKYVSTPILCYYRADKTYREIGLQILVPRDISETTLCPVE